MAAALAAGSAAFARGQEGPSPENRPGLSNFAKVGSGLYRGAQPETEGFAELGRLGVRTIVNLRPYHDDREKILKALETLNAEPGRAKPAGFYYLRLKFHTAHPEKEDLIPFLKLASDPRYQPVFVHCQHGADRTGTAVALYRIIHEAWEAEKALAEFPRFGFHKVWAHLKRYVRKADPAEWKRDLEAAKAPEPELIGAAP